MNSVNAGDGQFQEIKKKITFDTKENSKIQINCLKVYRFSSVMKSTCSNSGVHVYKSFLLQQLGQRVNGAGEALRVVAHHAQRHIALPIQTH